MPFEIKPTARKKIGFQSGSRFRAPHITQTVYISNNFFLLSLSKDIDMKMRFKSMGGLRVKDGRLINDRPDGITGIAQAAQLRKAMYKAKKVDMLADGIELAEGRKNFYRL